jgi:hypothetical protein
VKTSSKTPILSKNAKPTSYHALNTGSDASEREREKKSYVCHKTHENTSIGSRREEMKSL